jgi:hypothetical protein
MALLFVREMFSERAMEYWMLGSGTAQLIGIAKPGLRLLRIAGAMGVFLGFTCIFGAVTLNQPYTLGLSAYLVVMTIEFCAIIFQTAELVRYRERVPWITKA